MLLFKKGPSKTTVPKVHQSGPRSRSTSTHPSEIPDLASPVLKRRSVGIYIYICIFVIDSSTWRPSGMLIDVDSVDSILSLGCWVSIHHMIWPKLYQSLPANLNQ